MKSSRTKAKRTASRPPRRSKAEAVIELVPALVKIKSILVPVDFSDTSKKAVQYAVRMAEQFGSKIILLHVIEPVATPDFSYHPMMLEPEKAKAAARSAIDRIVDKFRIPASMLDRSLVRYGSAFAEITDAARTLKVDLIILTTHGYTGLKHVLMGSTAERVVRHAPCPVLTVREKEHEFV